MNIISLLEVKIAYKKLKSYVYHENFSLNLRLKLAEFEDERIEKKLIKLTNDLNEYLKAGKGLKKHFEKIDISLMPKSFKENDIPNPTQAFYFSNANRQLEYIVERETPFIDCPVEIHIISILWIMKIGHSLDAELSKCCYGNRLHRNGDEQFEENSIKLFKRYYLSYNSWRDNAIKKAKGLHKLGLDVAILSLDLRSYYNSIDFDFSKINIRSPYSWLTDIVKEVHKVYLKHLVEKGILHNEEKLAMPIGLISSNILANYYLKEFDKEVIKWINPEFYGRYVDDMMFVISNPKIDIHPSQSVNSFIDQFLADKRNWAQSETAISKEEEEDSEYRIRIGANELYFQLSKVKLFHFLSNESSNLLDEFEKEIKKNSSEFKFQPESKNIFESFENSSYKISYSDTINKLRSINGFNIDKLGASKHLSKLISSTINAEKLSAEKFENLNEKIVNYFSGKRSLELNALWEKVFTFYVINSAKEELINFAKDQVRSILKIRYKELKKDDDDNDSLNDIQVSMFIHLISCFSMAAALNTSFFNEALIYGINDGLYNSQESKYFKFITLEAVKSQAQNLLASNLFRHNYNYYPLLNYCKQHENFNFLNKQLDSKSIKFNFDDRKIEYSPRFIHYHEICLFYSIKNWFKPRNIETDYLENQFSFLFEKYISLNKLSDKAKIDYKKFYPIEKPLAKSKGKYEAKIIEIKTNKPKDKLTIGLVNTFVEFETSKASLYGKPDLSFKRLDEINLLLNEALNAQKCDVIIFPEISIPFQWLPLLSSFSKKNNIVISCGIEHFTNDVGEAFNYVATILPFEYRGYQNAVIDFRLKKDYSPQEIEEIEGRKFTVPFKYMSEEQMRLYVWNDVYFSVFNCFELADIRKRAIFRGCVDFMAVVEHNSDVNYFSNIIESVSRDIHCYVVQVNSSHYGDSRITQPSETFRKDIVKIKGGNNVSLITGTIDIKALRDFQKTGYQLQKRNKVFKPTPPNFEVFSSRIKKNKN